MSFSLRRALSFFILSSVIVGILWWDYKIIDGWFAFQDETSEFRRNQKEFHALTLQIKKVAPNKTKEQIVEELEQIKASVFQNLRVRDSNAVVVGFISRAASAIGLKEVSPSIKNTIEIGRYGPNVWERTHIKINARARYHEAARLINLLEQSPYLFKIRGYSIQRGQKDPTGPTYTTIIVYLYRMK